MQVSIKIIIGLLCFMQAGCVQDNKVSSAQRQLAVQKRLELASLSLLNNKMQMAKYNLDEILKHAPNNLDANILQAAWFQRQGLLKDASESYHLALEIDASNLDLQQNYATFLCEIKKYDEALEKFDELMKQINSVELIENKAKCLLQSGQAIEPNKYFYEAMQRHENAFSLLLYWLEKTSDANVVEKLLRYADMNIQTTLKQKYHLLQVAEAQGFIDLSEKWHQDIMVETYVR